MRIFIDMDGVLCDFVGGVCDIVGYKGNWPPGEYDICKVVGRNIWPILNARGIEFWENLRKTDEADEIISIVQRLDYYICTSPTLDPQSAAGKLTWLNRNYPQVMKERRFFITPHKHLLACKDNVLIDDSDDQIVKWITSGGKGILIPRPWNKFHAKTDIMADVHRFFYKEF